MNLVLIGYRGTGKTTVATCLARRIGWQAVDADVELERRAGRTIAEIFAADGEGEFRRLEAEVLADLGRQGSLVLATGGGVILREENRRRLGEMGPVVWLTATPEIILARLAGDATTAARRPKLTSLGDEAEIRRLLAEREPWYRAAATWTLDTEGREPEELAAAIAEHFAAEISAAGAR